MIVNSQSVRSGLILGLFQRDTSQCSAGVSLLGGQLKKKERRKTKKVTPEMIVLHRTWLTLNLKKKAQQPDKIRNVSLLAPKTKIQMENALHSRYIP